MASPRSVHFDDDVLDRLGLSGRTPASSSGPARPGPAEAAREHSLWESQQALLGRTT